MTVQESTTIQLSKETREKLKEIGKMGETYDDVIKRLIKTAKECEKRNE
jgi:predicted CopG family antitoxin